MKFVYRPLCLSLAAILFYQCQKELKYVGGGDTGPVVFPSPLKANLQGNILDENGQPAENVAIKVGNATATTDVNGYFRINNASLDRNASLVTAQKAGYFTAYRCFSATSGTNQVVIKLTRRSLSGTINGSGGGDVSVANGAKVSLPANGIVKAADNSEYSGTVNIYAAYIDPTATDILDRVPGSFMANDKNGKRVLLSSYGMIAVEMESTNGEKLQIKPGNAATLTLPIPAAAQSSAPADIPLWYVEESNGLWKEEGTASKQGSSYVGTVKHFSYWNCDVPVSTVILNATFKTAKGEPLINASIAVKPATGNYYGSAHGYTDSLGQISGPIPANMNLILELIDACGGAVYSQNIGPYSQNVNLGTITVPASTRGVINVTGKLTNCSGGNVTNGYAIVSVKNWVHYAKVDANGNFSTNYVLCNINGVNAQVLGVDEGAQQQGNSTSVAVTAPTTDFGSLSACGTVSTEFIDYTLDGSNFHLGSTDSLLSYSVDSVGTATDFTYVMGSRSPNFIQFHINTTAQTAGSYALTALSVQNYFQNTIVQPLNVNLTSFALSAGQFYEGNFTGQFKDGSNVTHNVSCTFRVRRTF